MGKESLRIWELSDPTVRFLVLILDIGTTLPYTLLFSQYLSRAIIPLVIKRFVPLLLIVIVLSACSSTKEVLPSPQEILNAQQAVVLMLEMNVESATESFISLWNPTVTDLIPETFSQLLALQDEVPGLKYYIDGYVQAIKGDVREMVKEIPGFLEKELLPSINIEEPFSLIRGSSDAITRFFASHYSEELESWLTRLIEQKSHKGLKAWDTLIRHYNIYVEGVGRLTQEEAVLLEGNPSQTITITIIRQLIESMKAQEALVRSLAPTYDESLLLLFSR